MSNRHQNNLFVTLESLINSNHLYRQLDQLIDFDKLATPFNYIYSNQGRKEKGVAFGLRTLVLQLLEDLSDRAMERYLSENLAAK